MTILLCAQPRCTTTAHDLTTLANGGLALSRRGQYSAAADCYRKALAINPKIAGIQLNLALAEFKIGHFREAVAPLQAVLLLDAGNTQARILLPMSYYGLAKYADAVPLLSVALAAQPANFGAVLRAGAKLSLGRGVRLRAQTIRAVTPGKARRSTRACTDYRSPRWSRPSERSYRGIARGRRRGPLRTQSAL